MKNFSEPIKTHSAISNSRKARREDEIRQAPPPNKVSKKLIAKNLAEQLDMLKRAGGNLDTYLKNYIGVEDDEREAFLFNLYIELDREDNEDFKAAWNAILRMGYRLRMDLAKCRAADRMAKFVNLGTSQAPDISWIKTVLSEELILATETSKKKVARRYGVIAGGPDDDDEDDGELGLVDQIEQGMGADE